MNQRTTREIKETMKDLHTSFIPRIEAGTLKPQDAAIMAEIAEDLKKKIMKEPDRNGEPVKDIYNGLTKIQEVFGSPGIIQVSQLKELETSINRNMDELEKISHIANALQLDTQSIMPLLEQLRQKQEEVRQSFQSAVDMDFKLYGKVSDLTGRALEAYHYEISNSREVVAVKEVSVEHAKEGPAPEPVQEEKEKIRKPEEPVRNGVPAEQKQEREYLHIMPQTREQFKETTEFLKQNGGRYDPEKGERGAWYIPEGKIPLMELLAHRVEPLEEKREYLKLPPMGKEQFKDMVEFLKSNGARYDSKREPPAWYIFPGKEGDKIKDCLHRAAGEKESVLSKLGQNREKAGRVGRQNQKDRNDMER